MISQDMQFRIAFLFAFTLLGNLALQESAQADPPEGYELVWFDEFDGDAVDTDKWQFRTDSKHWSTQLPENVTVSDGNLYLNLKKEQSQGKDYTGSGVITKETFRYGYYESRFKVPKGDGWHTSFWLMGYDGKGTGPKNACQEIDICEHDSNWLQGYNVNLHNWKGKHKNFGHKTVNTGSTLHEDFHTWGCEFTPTTIRYWFDGKLVREVDATVLEHNDHSVWLTSIASHLGGTEKVDDSTLPSAAIFDYVRVYKKAE